MTSKWTQNGIKQRLGTQVGAIVNSLRPQCDLEIGSRNLEVASCNLTLPLQELKVGSKPSKNVSNCPKGPKKQPRDTQMSRNHSNSRKRSMVILILKFGLTLRCQKNKIIRTTTCSNPCIMKTNSELFTAKICTKPANPLSSPTAGNTSRCGGVASAFSIKCHIESI